MLWLLWHRGHDWPVEQGGGHAVSKLQGFGGDGGVSEPLPGPGEDTPLLQQCGQRQAVVDCAPLPLVASGKYPTLLGGQRTGQDGGCVLHVTEHAEGGGSSRQGRVAPLHGGEIRPASPACTGELPPLS